MSVDLAVERAPAEALGATTRRQFTITRFERHPDGYLHARVVVSGKPYYFHSRYGAWFAPGRADGRDVQKEPEGLLGSKLGQEVKFTLAERARAFRRAEQKAEEEHRGGTGTPEDAGVDSSAGATAGLLEGGDHRDPV